jgi:tRNA nucleotidyltransferase (CCA-adding enzyme)
MKVKDLAINGGDVMRVLAVPPGRIVGEILEKLLERVIDDPALNEREKLEALVPEIADELKKPKPN